MSVQVSGTVQAPAADYSHIEPTDPVAAGSVPAGSTSDVYVGDVKNTGNVDQTLTVSDTNASGCTVNGFDIEVNGAPEGNGFTLTPGTAAKVIAHISTPAEAIGSTDQPFSFEVDFSWV